MNRPRSPKGDEHDTAVKKAIQKGLLRTRVFKLAHVISGQAEKYFT